jgi:hypothetical protein
MACGMAAETGKPVIITCTGATASRNYLPGLTEAYYRKLPVMAVCGHRGISAIGHLQDQQIDRRNEPVDVAKEQVWLPFVKDDEDERLCYNEITKAILALSIHGGGPVIINLCTHYSQNLSIQKLPDVKNVNFYKSTDNFPSLPHGRIAITLGSHRIFTQEETEIIDAFCAQYDAVVFCDHTSGFKGKYAVLPGLIMMQEESSNLCFADIIFPFISFKTPTLQNLLKELKELCVDPNDNSFEKHFILGGVEHTFAMGGVHSVNEPERFEPSDDEELEDVDVDSMYPSIIVSQELYPQHLGPEFTQVYAGILFERLEAKRNGNKLKNETLKLSVNGLSGNLQHWRL